MFRLGKAMRRLKWWLRGLFIKPVVDDYGSGDNVFTPKWGFVIPHEKKAQGASSYNDQYSEYTYGVIMAGKLDIPYATRDNAGVYGAVREMVKKAGVNASVECHFNSYNGRANGFEILVIKGDKISERYARLLVEEFILAFPKRKLRGDNGLKFISKGDRGFYNLVNARSAGADVAILTEFFFGDCKADWITPAQHVKIIKRFCK